MRVFHYANQLFLFRAGSKEQVRVEDRPTPGNFGLQMASFVERIRTGRPAEVTGEDGYRALRIILAAYESAGTSTAIRF